jgi:hypothetical protein
MPHEFRCPHCKRWFEVNEQNYSLGQLDSKLNLTGLDALVRAGVNDFYVLA